MKLSSLLLSVIPLSLLISASTTFSNQENQHLQSAKFSQTPDTPLSQSSDVSISSLFFNFTTGLEVPTSGIQDINLFLGNINPASQSYQQSWTYYITQDPAMTNHQATLNLTYGLQLTGNVITHFLNAYLAAYNSVRTFSTRFTNYEHMILSMNATYYSYILNVTASQMSILINAQNSLWNIVSKEIGRLFKITFLTQAVSYTAPAALNKEKESEFKSDQLYYTNPLQLKLKNEAEAKERRQSYERLKALSLEGFSTDYYYYPVDRSTFSDTDRVNIYKHFLFYANLLQPSTDIVACPVAYSAFSTLFFSSMTHFGSAATSTTSLVNGLYRLAESFQYIYEAYNTCWILGNIQYTNLGNFYTAIGGNPLYWMNNIQNRRYEIANLFTAYYPCVRMGDWECVARVTGQIVSLVLTTVST